MSSSTAPVANVEFNSIAVSSKTSGAHSTVPEWMMPCHAPFVFELVVEDVVVVVRIAVHLLIMLEWNPTK